MIAGLVMGIQTPIFQAVAEIYQGARCTPDRASREGCKLDGWVRDTGRCPFPGGLISQATGPNQLATRREDGFFRAGFATNRITGTVTFPP